jgi:hypothetical protein
MRHRWRLLNVMRRNWRRVAAVAMVIAAALAVAWTQDAAGARPDQATKPSAVAQPETLSATDAAFLQLMVPMDDSALALFAVITDASFASAPASAGKQALVELARRLTADHRAELRDMRALLAAAGVPDRNIHEGHQMPGMILSEELDELRQAPAGESVARAVVLIRAHLAQGLLVATSESQNGSNATAKGIADRLRRSRAEQQDRLESTAALAG